MRPAPNPRRSTRAPSSFSVSATTVRASGSSSTTRIDKPERDSHARRVIRDRRCRVVPGSPRLTGREAGYERRAPPDTRALCRDGSTVKRHDLAHERQSQPQSTGMPGARAVALPETIEHVRQQLGRDALPGVLDAAVPQMPPTLRKRNRDLAAGGGELQGIRQQVGHHLLQPVRIAAQLAGAWLDVGMQGDAFRGRRRPRQIQRRCHDFRELHRTGFDPQLARLDPARGPAGR